MVALVVCLLVNILLQGVLLREDVLPAWLWSLAGNSLALFLIQTFSIPYRILNTIYPGYGNLSAGGGFALMTALICFTTLGWLGIPLALVLSRTSGKKKESAAEESCSPEL